MVDGLLFMFQYNNERNSDQQMKFEIKLRTESSEKKPMYELGSIWNQLLEKYYNS